MSVQLHVPAIGTGLILRQPWDFRLYFEDRNSKLINNLTGQKFSWHDFYVPWEGEWVGEVYRRKRKKKSKWAGQKLGGYTVKLDDFGLPEDDEGREQLSATWKNHTPMEYIDVRIPAGAVLTVDRIYIRKGVDAYNSLTFWLRKPAKLKKPKKGEPVPPVDPDYEFLAKAGGTRFWAKLPDVNRIICDII